jgi:hypothetical protein
LIYLRLLQHTGQFQNLNSTVSEARWRNFYIFAFQHPRTRVIPLSLHSTSRYQLESSTQILTTFIVGE